MSFCRVQYCPAGANPCPLDPWYAPNGWFVLVAESPHSSNDGRERFKELQVTRYECGAAVFTQFDGAEILRVIRQTQPPARLVPATFAEWVESPAFSLYETAD